MIVDLIDKSCNRSWLKSLDSLYYVHVEPQRLQHCFLWWIYLSEHTHTLEE